MTTSEQIGDLAAALAKAQAGMKNAVLNKVNPHYRSKYADLAGIRDAVIPALTAQARTAACPTAIRLSSKSASTDRSQLSIRLDN